MADKENLVPVMLVGGSGDRLWPLSRAQHPKQFLHLTDPEYSLLQLTVLRAAEVTPVPPLLIGNDSHRFLIVEQLRAVNVTPGSIVLEPCGRNTAPAITLAALHTMNREEDPLLLVLPTDHDLVDAGRFAQGVAGALESARDGKIVAFGIKPSHGETGYGYISTAIGDGGTPCPINHFVEKPGQKDADAYASSGRHFWNSGILLCQASAYLEEMRRFAPDILEQCMAAYARATRDGTFIHLDEASFRACRADSVDYAVMEHTRRAVMVELKGPWSDVGGWAGLWNRDDHRDHDGNVTWGDVLLQDTKDSYVRSESRLVATLGVSGLVVIETPDAVFVAPRDRAQGVHKIVRRLQHAERPEAGKNRRVYRPWGAYESLVIDDGFQVKRIVVNPGASLSLQMHHHRAEHWTVVRGTAQVTRGEEQFLLSEDQSTYIPLGTKHRLENPGVIPLEVIEVQTGNYLGEDDIVRFDDRYGR